MDVLGWDRDRTTVLVQACGEELNKRLRQVQAMQSLSAHSQQRDPTSTESHEEETQVKRSR